jgi:DNA-binding transcriptional LysR family regulator
LGDGHVAKDREKLTFSYLYLPAPDFQFPRLHQKSDIKLEITIEEGLTDIVSQRYDAGVRSGETIAKDMIAVRIGPDMRMAVGGSPSYFANRTAPKTHRS